MWTRFLLHTSDVAFCPVTLALVTTYHVTHYHTNHSFVCTLVYLFVFLICYLAIRLLILECVIQLSVKV